MSTYLLFINVGWEISLINRSGRAYISTLPMPISAVEMCAVRDFVNDFLFVFCRPATGGNVRSESGMVASTYKRTSSHMFIGKTDECLQGHPPVPTRLSPSMCHTPS